MAYRDRTVELFVGNHAEDAVNRARGARSRVKVSQRSWKASWEPT
jgi:hypothetical protein